jgi:hypothetical protein
MTVFANGVLRRGEVTVGRIELFNERHNLKIYRLKIEICALLGYYASSCGDCLPTCRDNVSVPSSRVALLTREDGTDTFSRNVGKKSSHDAA